MAHTPSLAPKFLTIGALTLALSLPLPAVQATSPSAEAPRILDGVHTDAIAADIVGKELQLFTYADLEEGNRTRLDPAKTVFYIPSNSNSMTQVPRGFEFIAEEGKTIWLAPQTQVPDVLWPGWNTEDIARGEVQGDSLMMELVGAQTPEGASVEVFQTDIYGGANRIWSSDEDIKKYSQAVHAHVHSNWAFTHAGIYKLTFKVSGTLTDGTPVSAEQTYTFAVGVDPTTALEGAEGQAESPAPTPTAEPTSEQTAEASPTSTQPAPVETPAESPSRAPESQPTPPPADVAQPGSEAASTPGAPAPEAPAPSPEVQQAAPAPAPHTPTQDADTWQVAPAPAPQPVTGNQQVAPAQQAPAQPGSQPAEQCLATEITVETPQAAGIFKPSSQQSRVSAQPTNLPLVSISTVNNHTVQNRATEGHFDFGAVLSGSSLTAQVKDDRTSPANWVEPQTLKFVLADKAKTKLPAGMDYIGAAGSEVYLIGATQQEGVPWLGWNTQDPQLVKNMEGKAKLTLNSVTGPGKMAVFLSGNFGSAGQKVFDSDQLGSFEVPKNTHQHGNWAFTAPGNYTANITWSVKLKDGSTKTASGTLYFEVGDVPQKAEQAQTGQKTDAGKTTTAEQAPQKQDQPGHTPQQAEKPAKGSVDKASGIVTKPDGSKVKIVGKTASGADCNLTAAELETAQLASAEGKLAHTGAGALTLPLLAGGAALAFAGSAVLYLVRRRTHA